MTDSSFRLHRSSYGEAGTHRYPTQSLAYMNTVDSAWLASTFIVAAILIGIFVDEEHLLVASVLLAAGATMASLVEIRLLNKLRLATTSFSFCPDGVYVARGALFRRYMSISSAQILSVEIVDGPLLRQRRLVKLRLVSIASSESIGPLTPEVALNVRNVLLGPAEAR